MTARLFCSALDIDSRTLGKSDDFAKSSKPVEVHKHVKTVEMHTANPIGKDQQEFQAFFFAENVYSVVGNFRDF